jgi:hypothetical protein
MDLCGGFMPDKPKDTSQPELAANIEMFRPLAALIARPALAPAPPAQRGVEPPHFYINVFQDNRRFWLNSEAGFEQLADCYESILDGQRDGTYRYTLHVWRDGDERRTHAENLEDDARAWREDGAAQIAPSFVYANSAGRRK